MVTEVLRTDDGQLLGADPALPGLAVLLDDDALTQFLQQRNPAVRGAHATYLRYKPGTAMVAAVQVRTDDGERLALAQTVSRAGGAKLDKLARSAKDRRTWCYLDDELILAVASAGADRHLPGLNRELERPGVSTVRYKPARRWVGRRGRGARAVLTKVFDGDQAAHGATAVKALAAAGVPGPQLRADRAHRHALTFAWTDGVTLDRQDRPDLHAAGMLLAQVHQMPWPLTSTPGRNWRRDVHDGGTGVADLAQVVPDLHGPAARSGELVADLATLLAAPEAPLVTSHGDCSADQVLAEPDGSLRILDLDSLVQAPREFDLGEWIGEALARTCPPGTESEDLERFVSAGLQRHAPLLAGYTEYSGADLDASRVLAIAAVAVLSRAAEPFRLRHSRWISAARTRVDLAAHLAWRAQRSQRADSGGVSTADGWNGSQEDR